MRGSRLLWFCCCAITLAQQSPHTDIPTFQSKVNLVLVPVVVRDAQGRAVPNLTKGDFELFDGRKRQSISSFSVVSRVTAPTATSASPNSNGHATISPNTAPEAAQARSLIYLFDDLNIRFADMANIRDAAVRHLQNNLAPGDRAAVYAFSGNPALDFTADRQKLEQAVASLRWRPANSHSGVGCPDVSYYMADLIINKNEPGALDALTYQASVCSHVRPDVARQIAWAAANRKILTGATDTQVSLRTIRRAIRTLSGMPGQRLIVLASPGFFAQTPEAMRATAEIKDLAARSNVVISSVSVRGIIVAEEEEDVAATRGFSRRPPGATAPKQMWVSYRRESARADGDVLNDLAEGTGGTFYHNNNDLLEGFAKTSAGPEFSYVLGFTPAELKPDGSFHHIKVRLTEPRHFSVGYRRGYYALKDDPKDRWAITDLMDAVFARDEVAAIPIVLQAGYSKLPGNGTAKVLIVAKVDITAVHFAAKRDSLKVAAALFDSDGSYVTGEVQNIDLTLNGEAVPKTDPGVTLRFEFDVNPGTYRVRLVAREAQGKAMTSINHSLVVFE